MLGYQPGMLGPNGQPLGPMGKVHSIMHGMESSVQSFGRISQLLHMNFDVSETAKTNRTQHACPSSSLLL
jgi:4'-phosphopantetheinyl transferase EntD